MVSSEMGEASRGSPISNIPLVIHSNTMGKTAAGGAIFAGNWMVVSY